MKYSTSAQMHHVHISYRLARPAVPLVISRRFIRTRSRKVSSNENVNHLNQASIQERLSQLGLHQVSLNNVESSLSGLLNLPEHTSANLNSIGNLEEHFELLFKSLLAESFKELSAVSKPRNQKRATVGPTSDFLQVSKIDLVISILEETTRSPELKQKLSMESLFQAFELAKIIPDTEQRQRAIALAGKAVYSLNKLRFDPYNESTYISVLASQGDEEYKEALKLWRLRLNWKDVSGQRWWYELGITIALNHFSLEDAVKIVEEYFKRTKGDNNYLDPELVSQLIVASCEKGAHEKVLIWLGVLLKIRNELLIEWAPKTSFKAENNKKGRKKDRKKTKVISDELNAQEFLNEKIPPTGSQFFKAVKALLAAGEVDRASKLVADIAPAGASVDAKAQDGFVNELTSFINNLLPSDTSDRNAVSLISFIRSNVLDHYLSTRKFDKAIAAITLKEKQFDSAIRTTEHYQNFITELENYKVPKDQIKALREAFRGNAFASVEDSYKFYHKLIASALRCNRPQVADLILRQMEISHLALSGLNSEEGTSLSNNDSIDLADVVAIFQKHFAETEGSSFVPPVTAKTYSLFISHYFKTNNLSNVTETINRLMTLKVDWADGIITQIVSNYAKKSQFDHGLGFLQLLKSSGDGSLIYQGPKVILVLWKLLYKLSSSNYLLPEPAKSTENINILLKEEFRNLAVHTESVLDNFIQNASQRHDSAVTYNALATYCNRLTSNIVATFFNAGNYAACVMVLQYLGTVMNINPDERLLAVSFELSSRLLLQNAASEYQPLKGAKPKHLAETNTDRSFIRAVDNLLFNNKFSRASSGQNTADVHKGSAWQVPAITIIEAVQAGRGRDEFERFQQEVLELQEHYGLERMCVTDIFSSV